MYFFTKHIDFNVSVPILYQALQIATYDGYRAQASYQNILDRFGQAAPFHNTTEAENHHINAFLPLLKYCQIPKPVNDWYPHKTFINLREAPLTTHLPAFRQCTVQKAILYLNSCTNVGSQPSWLWALGSIAVGFMVSKTSRTTALGAS